MELGPGASKPNRFPRPNRTIRNTSHGKTHWKGILHREPADGHVTSSECGDGRRVMVMSIVVFLNVSFRTLPENVTVVVVPHGVEVSCEIGFRSGCKWRHRRSQCKRSNRQRGRFSHVGNRRWPCRNSHWSGRRGGKEAISILRSSLRSSYRF